MKKSIGHFEQAIAIDPNYVLAYAGLAHSYWVMGLRGVRPPKEVFPQAKAAATQALAIDDQLGEAHSALGMAIMLYD